jgi:hypothetical protein
LDHHEFGLLNRHAAAHGDDDDDDETKVEREARNEDNKQRERNGTSGSGSLYAVDSLTQKSLLSLSVCVRGGYFRFVLLHMDCDADGVGVVDALGCGGAVVNVPHDSSTPEVELLAAACCCISRT